MARSDLLTDFVRDALASGRSRDDITHALASAGWSDGEIRDALSAWSDAAFVPPVPRPRGVVTARDFFLYSVLFIVLGMAAFNLVALLHGIIDIYVDDATGFAAEGAPYRIRWAIASLIVAGPIYLWLAYRDARRIASDPGQRRSAIRKWLTYVALLIAAVVFLGDAVYGVYRFLDGDLTLTFVLKALSVAVVSGLVFLYYLRSVDGSDDE